MNINRVKKKKKKKKKALHPLQGLPHSVEVLRISPSLLTSLLNTKPTNLKKISPSLLTSLLDTKPTNLKNPAFIINNIPTLYLLSTKSE